MPDIFTEADTLEVIGHKGQVDTLEVIGHKGQVCRTSSGFLMEVPLYDNIGGLWGGPTIPSTVPLSCS